MSLKEKIIAASAKAGARLAANSPHIAVGVGVVGLVTSGVLATRATLKSQDIIEDHKNMVSITHEAWKLSLEGKADYSEDDYRKEQFIIWSKTLTALGRKFLVPISLGVLSIGCIYAGQHMMAKRLLSATTAYHGLATTFGIYRKEIQEKLGIEDEREVIKNVTTKAQTVGFDGTGANYQFKDDENGEVEIERVSYPGIVQHWFDENTSPNFRNGYNQNLAFLSDVQRMMNDRLRQRGFLFLSEVYEALGFQWSRTVHDLGWVYTHGSATSSFVDFGLDLDTPAGTPSVDQMIEENALHPNAMLLDFNIDGIITNRI